MPSEFKNSALKTERTLIAGSDLVSLATGSRVLGGAIDPTADRNALAYLKCLVKVGTNLALGARINLWFLKAPDGTNYESGTTTLPPGRDPDYVLYGQLGNSTTQQYLGTKGPIEFPNCKFKVLYESQLGQTHSATSGECGLSVVEFNPEAQ